MKLSWVLILLLFSPSIFAWDYSNEPYDQNREPNYRYEGPSGQRYQYDFSDPTDQLKYGIDLDAQMRDDINPSPMIDMDRDMDNFGGGAEW